MAQVVGDLECRFFLFPGPIREVEASDVLAKRGPVCFLVYPPQDVLNFWHVEIGHGHGVARGASQSLVALPVVGDRGCVTASKC